MKKKTTLKDWIILLSIGGSMWLAMQLVLIIVAMVVAGIITWMTGESFWIMTLLAYFAIRLIIEIPEALSGFRSVRCPSCNHKIVSRKPVKCVECGGRISRK